MCTWGVRSVEVCPNPQFGDSLVCWRDLRENVLIEKNCLVMFQFKCISAATESFRAALHLRSGENFRCSLSVGREILPIFILFQMFYIWGLDDWNVMFLTCTYVYVYIIIVIISNISSSITGGRYINVLWKQTMRRWPLVSPPVDRCRTAPVCVDLSLRRVHRHLDFSHLISVCQDLWTAIRGGEVNL